MPPFLSHCVSPSSGELRGVRDSAPTPMWLRAFACGSVAAVVGGMVWIILSPPARKQQQAEQPPGTESVTESANPRTALSKPAGPQPKAALIPTLNAIPTGKPPAIPAGVTAKWHEADGPDLAVAFISDWGAKDPAAAAQWLVSQPDSPARSSAAEALAELWARRDLNAPTKWAIGLAEEGILKSLVLDRLAAAWAEKDPLIGAGYYATLPRGETRKLGASALFERWAQRDPGGLHGSLSRIPAAITDEARTSLAPLLFPRNSTEAMNVLCGVKNKELRIDSISQMYDYWRRRSRASASAWLAISPLTPEERSRVSGGQ